MVTRSIRMLAGKWSLAPSQCDFLATKLPLLATPSLLPLLLVSARRIKIEHSLWQKQPDFLYIQLCALHICLCVRDLELSCGRLHDEQGCFSGAKSHINNFSHHMICVENCAADQITD